MLWTKEVSQDSSLIFVPTGYPKHYSDVIISGPGEFPTQRQVTRSFDVFFDLRLNKRLSKQP